MLCAFGNSALEGTDKKSETPRIQPKEKNAMKAPHRYAVKGSDTTMMPIAASLFGQKN